MPAINRYTNLTPSAYNPMSLNEIIMVPQLKRMQHNQADQNLIDIESQLAKVDPLDVHLNEANALRSNINNQVRQQAERLATEGFNNNTLSGVRRTNRELADLMAPTGKLGQINAAKPAYYAERKAYLDNAEKQGISPEAAIMNWNDFSKRYSGYKPDGSISNITSLGAPNKQNLQDDIKYYHSILGSKETGAAANGYNIVERPDGSLIFQDRRGNLTTKTNVPQLDDALAGINAKWLTPQGEGARWAQHNRLDPNNIRNQINSAFRSMIETSKVDTRSWENQYVAPREGDDGDESSYVPAVTEPAVMYDMGNDSFIDKISGIGESKKQNSAITSAISLGSANRFGIAPDPIGDNTKRASTIDDLNPDEKQRYLDLYKGLKANGTIPANIGLNSKEASSIINNYLKQHSNLSYSNKILKPDALPNDIQAALGIETKDANKRNQHIGQEIKAGRIKLYDKSGKRVDLDDIEKPEFDYIGFVSPDNMLDKFETGNKDASVIPQVIQITDKDGKTIEVYGTRDSNDMRKPSYKAAKTIKEVTYRAKSAPSLPITYTSTDLKQRGISSVTNIYDPSTDTYSIQFKTEKGNTYSQEGVSSEALQNLIYNYFEPSKTK